MKSPIARKLSAKFNWAQLDVTRRSIEETAAAILKLFTDRQRQRTRRMTLWRGKDPLILASQSRARQMLLANAGIHFEAVPADIDERAVQKASGLSAPGEIAGLLAREKARWVSSRQPGRYVIGADQTLALGDAAVQQAGRPRAGRGAIARACRPQRMNCTPPLRLRATARYCSPMSRSRA